MSEERLITEEIINKIGELAVGGLPKWPQMLVSGKPVTINQAKDIIFRTDDFLTDPWEGAGGNEREFNKAYRKAANLDALCVDRPNYDSKGTYRSPDWKKQILLREKIGFVQTGYVTNDWASSCYIFGGHGWCHPDGTIAFIDNVGKWPNIEDVCDDWARLARAFPYLDLNVTLMDNESGDENATPVVNIRVVNGTVDIEAPDVSVHTLKEKTRDFSVAGIFSQGRKEIGLPLPWYDEYAAKVRAIIETL